MARHNRRKKKLRMSPTNVGFVVLLLLNVVPWSAYLMLRTDSEQIADRIRTLESDRRVYTQALIREQSAWNAIREPRNLDEAVRTRGLKLSFPAPETVVHVSPDGSMRASRTLMNAVADARARRLNGEPSAIATASAGTSARRR